MSKIMEAVFCILYLAVTGTIGAVMLKTSKKNKPRFKFGTLVLVLVGGDAFHLVPRIYGAFTGTTDNLYAALGFGTLVTSVTMTVFYVILWEFWRVRTGGKRGVLSFAVYILAVCRIALCMFPHNAWLSENPSFAWGIYRNIPFAILGGIVAYQFFKGRAFEKHFKFAWLAVTLSFLFYLPVVIFADTVPIVGVLMIPKTVCYVWLVLMGYKATKAANQRRKY